MKRKVFGYSFLFYSFYRYYLKKWEFSSDWPQGWAVAALSMLVSLAAMGLKLMLIKHEILSSAELLKGFFILLISLAVNSCYFFYNKKWAYWVGKYDAFSKNEKVVSYWISGGVILFVVVFYFYQILSFNA